MKPKPAIHLIKDCERTKSISASKIILNGLQLKPQWELKFLAEFQLDSYITLSLWIFNMLPDTITHDVYFPFDVTISPDLIPNKFVARLSSLASDPTVSLEIALANAFTIALISLNITLTPDRLSVEVDADFGTFMRDLTLFTHEVDEYFKFQ